MIRRRLGIDSRLSFKPSATFTTRPDIRYDERVAAAPGATILREAEDRHEHAGEDEKNTGQHLASEVDDTRVSQRSVKRLRLSTAPQRSIANGVSGLSGACPCAPEM
jgi:hypothetical protein